MVDVALCVLAIFVLPVCAALAALTVVACVPFVLQAAGACGRTEPSWLRVRVRWGGRILSVDYWRPGDACEVRLFGRRVFRRTRPAGRGAPLSARQAADAVQRHGGQDWGRLGTLMHAARQVWLAAEARGRLRCVLGLADPAETAMAAGVLHAARGLAPVPVDFAPDFAAERLTLEGRMQARLQLVALGRAGLGLLARSDTRNLIRGK